MNSALKEEQRKKREKMNQVLYKDEQMQAIKLSKQEVYKVDNDFVIEELNSNVEESTRSMFQSREVV